VVIVGSKSVSGVVVDVDGVVVIVVVEFEVDGVDEGGGVDVVSISVTGVVVDVDGVVVDVDGVVVDEVDSGGGDAGGVDDDPEPVPLDATPPRRASSCDLMMQVSAPDSSLTQSSLVCILLANRSPIPLAASASHPFMRSKRLLKKLEAKDSLFGVEVAEVEAIDSKLRLSSCIPCTISGMILV